MSFCFLLLCLCLLSSALAYHPRITHKRVALQLKSGYVSPEADPEYRNVVKKSLLRPVINVEVVLDEEGQNNLLPVPREGDIVQCPGKWKGEFVFGRIRFLRYATSSESWIADIVPLKEGKAANVYSVDRNAGTFFEKVENIKPVRSFFLRSENGYKVAYRRNTTELILKAPAYRSMNSTYVTPSKPVNLEVLKQDMVTYEELKKRIVLNTLKFGGVGTVAAQLAFGSDVSVSYLLGSASGALYLYFLGKKTDAIGSSFTLEGNNSVVQNKMDELMAKSRLLVPVLLIGLLAAKSSFVDGRLLEPFSALSRDSFLGAIAGFLTYRVSLFFTEVASEIRTEDYLSVVPGSMAEGYRLSKGMQAKEDAKKLANGLDQLTTIVFITGPQAAGRTSIASRLKKSGGKNVLQQVAYMTTDLEASQKYPSRYQYIGADELDKLREEGKLIYEGEEKGVFGKSTNIALAIDMFKAPSSPTTAQAGNNKNIASTPPKTYFLIDGPPEILDSLSKVSTFQLLNIWISLQTKEQFIEKATQIVQKDAIDELKGSKDKSTLAQRSAQQVTDLVNDAARDITFYMQKAPLFEYTLLNSG